MAQRPFEIQRLDHLVLRTRDIERLVAFYEGLGCTIVRKLDAMSMCQMRAGDSMIDIVSIAPDPATADSAAPDLAAPDSAAPDSAAPDSAAGAEQGRNLDHFAIRVEPFDESAILAYCKAHAIESQTMPMSLLGADGYGPAIYIKDPDGNRVELKGPPDADQTPPHK
ncbi:MAG: VOC family protein [Gammaproteobacteria bacterium]|nr:VOC family protein [Gammaproteobacteria bacterium]